ncbi:AtpZ/AtpI family protein [bacterium]|nr:AtpZ/AtpI family protein [bacterium]
MAEQRQLHRKNNLVRDLIKTSLGWELALPIVLGALLGYQIDRINETQYTFTLVLTILGIAIGYYSLVREIQLELLRLKVLKKREREERNA